MTSAQTTRTAILKAAHKLFIERGFEAVSVRDIAQLAKANLGAIPYYFETKSELFVETVKYASEIENKKLPITPTKDTSTAKDFSNGTALYNVIESFLQNLLHDDSQSICCVMFREIHNQHPETKKMRSDLISYFYEKYTLPLSDLLTSIVLAMNSEVPQSDAEELAESVVAQCIYFVTHKAFIEHDLKVKKLPHDMKNKNFITSKTKHIYRISSMAIFEYEKMREIEL